MSDSVLLEIYLELRLVVVGIIIIVVVGGEVNIFANVPSRNETSSSLSFVRFFLRFKL